MREKTRYTQVYKRGPSYSYRAYDENGKAFEKSGFKTAGEARDARLKALIEIKEGRYVHSPLTVSELCKRYSEYKIKRIRSSTYDNIRVALNKYIIPSLGNIKIDKLRIEHVERLVEDVKEKKGTKRANFVLSQLNFIINWGMKRRFVQFNPTHAIERYRTKPRDMVIFTDEEITNLLDAALTRDKVIISIGLFAGLRRCEIFALDINSFDFSENYIHVNKQLTKGKLVEVKTPSSIREVPLIQPLRNEIVKYAERASIFGCLFPSAKSGRLHAESWSRDTFLNIVKRAGIRECVFNDTRHSFGTRCAVSGVPVEMTAKIMGHSSIQTTYRNYYAPSIQDKIKGIKPFENSISSFLVAKSNI